jgi:hypothetical protein
VKSQYPVARVRNQGNTVTPGFDFSFGSTAHGVIGSLVLRCLAYIVWYSYYTRPLHHCDTAQVLVWELVCDFSLASSTSVMSVDPRVHDPDNVCSCAHDRASQLWRATTWLYFWETLKCYWFKATGVTLPWYIKRRIDISRFAQAHTGLPTSVLRIRFREFITPIILIVFHHRVSESCPCPIQLVHPMTTTTHRGQVHVAWWSEQLHVPTLWRVSTIKYSLQTFQREHANVVGSLLTGTRAWSNEADTSG